MIEMLKFQFIRNALLAGALSSIACGVIGSIVVSKRIVSLCGGIAHASFGGVGLGYLLKINPSFGALLFGMLTSLGIGSISKKAKQSEDTSIAIFWAVGMSLGIIFTGLAKGYVPDLFTYLFGNILAVSRLDLISILILDVFVGTGIALFYKEILALCFDEEFAKVRGIRIFALYLFVLLLVSITVVVLMKVVGIILAIALLSLPAATSSRFTRTLKGMIIFSIILNLLFIVSGLIISCIFDLPSGATIILIAAILFLAGEFIQKIKTRHVSGN